MKIAPPVDIFDQPPFERIHVGDHVVLSPVGAVLVISPWTKTTNPFPPQSLNDS